jgi:uncharacterized repeat protein (TIGR01451 family)
MFKHVAAALSCCLLFVSIHAGAIVAPVHEGERYFDIRTAEGKPQALQRLRAASPGAAVRSAAARQGLAEAEAALRQSTPGLRIQLGAESGGPEVVGVARGARVLTRPSSQRRETIARSFVEQNAALYGLSRNQAVQLQLDADYVNPAGNLGWVRLAQHVNGRPVFGSEVTVALTPAGEIARVVGQLAGAIEPGEAAQQAAVGAAQAVMLAASSVGIAMLPGDVQQLSVAADGRSARFASRVLSDEVEAKQVYFPLGQGALELAWSMVVWQPVDAYYTVIAASDGSVLWRKNITDHEAHTYRYYEGSNPAPFHPGPTDPTLNQQGLRVAPVDLLINSQNALGDPWLAVGQATTDGNNVEAGLDLAAPDGVDAPLGESGANAFLYLSNPPPGTPTPGEDPTTVASRNAAVTNLFYWSNRFHDLTYDLGFTEPARNFQDDNYGRGGVGGDRIRSEAQDSSGTNNANFSTPPDGGRGRNQMYLWTLATPNRDGSFDADIVVHELAHGLSNRLHNNSAGLSTNMARGMGEGWSDFYAHSLLAKPTDPINGIYTTGGYSTLGLGGSNSNYYHGIRRFPKAVIGFTGGPNNRPHNPLTFADIDSTQFNIGDGAYPPGAISGNGTAPDQVHNAGEIWSSALWEARAQIIGDMGAVAGNQRMLQLVTDGMKLSPSGPTFLQARDSIIAADCAAYGGSNEINLWTGFALRGMGFDAQVLVPGSGSGTARVVESFAGSDGSVPVEVGTTGWQPLSCSVANRNPTPGDLVQLVVPITNPLCGAALTNVVVSAPGGGSQSYSTLAAGASQTALVSYTIPANAVCGTTLQVPVTIAHDNGTQSIMVAVPIGESAIATTTFTNSTLINIPNGQPASTVGVASPYPSNITVSGIAQPVLGVRVTLNDYSHTFNADVDFLLVGPTGQKMVILADAFGSGGATNATVNLRDDAATLAPAANTPLSGVSNYRPTNLGASSSFVAPAPAGPYLEPAPIGATTFASAFGGLAANGTWSLYVVDDASGDAGTLAGGWTLTVLTSQPVVCVPCAVSGVTVTESAGTTAVSEGGATDNYEVVLNAAPSADVTVNLAFNAAQLTVDGDTDGTTSLLFTTANWDTPQVVNVVATNDMVVEAPLANSVIAQTITSADPAYAAVDPADVTVAVTDNDIAVVGFAANDDAVAEAGGNFQKAVILTITASGVGPASLQNALSVPLTFTEAGALEPEDFTLSTAQVTFAAGSTTGASQNAIAAIVNDSVDEDAESFAINLVTAGAPSNINFGRNTTNVQINDDDTAGVTLVQSGGTTAVTEGGAIDSYNVVLNSQPSANVGINIVFDPAQVILNGDTDGSLSLQFTPVNWNVAQTVTVSAVDDTLVEANPHSSLIVQTVSSSDPLYALINPADVTVSIAENDLQRIAFSLASSSVIETAGTHIVNARLDLVSNGTPGGTITSNMTASVNLTLGTAEASDISLGTTSLTFPAGSAHNSTLPIELLVVNDRLLEGDETATLSLALVSSIGSVSGTHVVTVIDDESGTISFTAPSSATSESAGTHSGAIGRLTISGSGTGPLASEAGVSAAITDAAGTATAPADYTRTTGTLVFAANTPSPVELPIAVSIANDALIENVESFSLGFGAISGAGALSASGAHGVSISDNDLAMVGFAPGNDSVGEGAGSFGKPVVLTLTADGAGTPSLQAALVVPIGFTEGTALEPEDFTLATASVSFAAGSLNGTAQSASASLVDDAVSEAAETFELTLGNGFVTPNITLGRAATTVSIVDNDIPGITVVQSGGSTAVAEGGATDNFTVVLTSQPTSNVTLALTGSQVTPTPSPLTFTPGNWNVAQTVTVTAIDDAIDESSPHGGSVSFVVSSADASYNGFPMSAVSVQVDDNDTAGVSVSEPGGNTAVTEGGATDSYTVVLSSQPTSDVAVILGVGAQASLSPSNLTFTAANWNVPQTVTVTATDDAVVEGAHSASITHSTSSSDPNYSGLPVAGITVAISDNDSAVVNFAPATVSQSEGSSPMVFSVTLSNPVASGVTLTLNSADGTATAADYTPIVAATVSFAAGSTTTQTVNVTIANDALDEDDESFSLTLSNLAATGDVSLGTASAGGIIVDDDATPTLTISSPSQPEGDVGLTPMDFVVSLSAISGRNVTFTRATADGTATVANNDYQSLAPTTITIPAGQPGTTLSVQIVGDTTFEGNESFSLNLSNIVNATTGGPLIEGTLPGLGAIGTIEEDDQQPTTTTITAHTPDPSVVGQPYTVTVNVAAVSSSPLGSVTISDGAVSCGPVVVTTATSPNSTASCALISTTVGTKTLVATYTAASSAFADSVSVGVPHQVNAAGTTISVSGPPRSRINQPTTFTFALSVDAPGGGMPTGTVTLSSGTASCNVTVPTATPSCALTFDTLGARAVSAAFAPSDGNFLASSSSGAGNAQTLVFALSDIAVTKSDGLGTYRPGDLVVYTVTVRNLGADAAAQIRVIDNVPAGLVDVVWTCDASGGVACPQAGGSGNLALTVASFPVGGLLNFTFFGNVSGSPAQIVNTALVVLPADTTIEDPVPGNNSATDTNLLELLFENGFEAVAVNAPNGSFRLPSASLRGSLDEVAVAVYELDDVNGEALRVYARVVGSEVQYALATRNAQGQLRLGIWASYASDPLLTWTARPVAEGWVLDSAGLR